MPKTDIEETDAYFLVSLEVPGIPKDNLHLEVIDNKELLVWGEASEGP